MRYHRYSSYREAREKRHEFSFDPERVERMLQLEGLLAPLRELRQRAISQSVFNPYPRMADYDDSNSV